MAGIYTLYSVTHVPFESIQVFAVDGRGAEPAISWTGCVKLPADFKSNAVTALSDGTILDDVQMHDHATDFISGNITGGVWEWSPKDKSLHLLKGTELPGNNGIEISKDEKEIYIAVSGTQTVAIYDLANTAKPARTIKTPWYNLDNIHWSGDRLIAAGMMFDEPACGGTRKQIQDAHGNMNCHRGWVASAARSQGHDLENPGLWRAQSRFRRHRHGAGHRQDPVAQLVPDGPRRIPAAAGPKAITVRPPPSSRPAGRPGSSPRHWPCPGR